MTASLLFDAIYIDGVDVLSDVENDGGYYTFPSTSVYTVSFVPKGHIELPEYAFYECPTIVEVYVPSSVTSIGTVAFGQDNHLEWVEFDSNAITLGDCCFCDNALETDALNQITSINQNAVCGCISVDTK